MGKREKRAGKGLEPVPGVCGRGKQSVSAVAYKSLQSVGNASGTGKGSGQREAVPAGNAAVPAGTASSCAGSAFSVSGRLIPDQDVKDRRHYFYVKPIYIGGYSAAALILFQGRFF